MGEVYRARDTKLNRSVALKVLPEHLAADPGRLSRLHREAQMLAALNHPSIGAIYGFEDSQSTHALVMELVEGVTLDERLKSGPIGMTEALLIARQAAEALEAAHERGIVHRDLKPANVKVMPNGSVKVLDFGLAKLQSHESILTTHLPTAAAEATMAGAILGTAPYMSPEQARGESVDRRADIWAFGCVLFELLTRARAFPGTTTADVFAGIIGREPDWSALPATTPDALRHLLRRCLEKDATRRLRDITEARLTIDDVLHNSTVNGGNNRSRAVGWRALALGMTALAVVGLLIALAFYRQRAEPTSAPVIVSRAVITLPRDEQLVVAESTSLPIAVSADGTRIAYTAEQNGRRELFLRELNVLDSKLVQGTEGATHPFFSPDGRWIGFFANDTLFKAPVDGGVPAKVCDAPGNHRGATWGQDDTIVFAAGDGGLARVSARGGTPEPLTRPDVAPWLGAHSWPQILPDGKTVLFTVNFRYLAVASLESPTRQIIARRGDASGDWPILTGSSEILQARYVSTGHLLVGRGYAIWAVPFDLASLSVSGEPALRVESVYSGPGGSAVFFGLSNNGVLVYAPAGNKHQLVWVDRNGQLTPVSDDRQGFRNPRLSRDGQRIAVTVDNPLTRTPSDIWVYDVRRGTHVRVSAAGHNLSPVWTADDSQVTFSNNDTIVSAAADGPAERQIVLSRPPGGTDGGGYPRAWSPDGQHLLFQARSTTTGLNDIWAVSRDGHLALVINQASESRFSPDGRWVAYASETPRAKQVYIAKYPDRRNTTAISADGGNAPMWAPSGRELFYRQGNALMAVPVDTTASPVRVGTPVQLFSGRYTGAGGNVSFDVDPSGRRFLMIKSDEASPSQQLVIVQNWFQELKQQAAGK